MNEYGDRKIAFYVVYAMKDLSESDARQHAKAYGYSCPAIIDRRHELVDAVGATVTPEAAVIDPEERLYTVAASMICLSRLAANDTKRAPTTFATHWI